MRAIVIHYTTEDDARSMQLLSKGKVSAHYLLSPGRAHRLVDETRAAWHAGNSSWYGITAMNSTSIGMNWSIPVDPGATAAASGTPMTTARSAP